VDQHVLVALMREVTNIQYTAPPLAWQPLRQALNPAPSADAQVMPVLPDVQFSVQHYNAQQHYALEEPAPVDRHQINAAVAGEQLLPNGQQEQDDEFNHYVRCSPAGDN
jgi:hypothetical protein